MNSLLHRQLYQVHSGTVPGTLLLCALVCLVHLHADDKKHTPSQIEFFENKIRPVLAQECYECHSTSGKKKGGLVLDYRDGLLEGGDTGPAIEPGDADASLLMEALRHEYGLEMPKAGVKLDPPIIDDFEKWINMGAPDPRDDPPTKEEFENDNSWSSIFETRKNWWSFQPVKKPKVPEGKGNAIDRFIGEKLQEAELESAPPAEAVTLARRLHYALIGLPPTVEQLEKFSAAAKTDRDEAVKNLIDELLASPRFGERWARHWMDWVRYAESHGSEGDPRIDNAHYYRDYLIRALNDDISYDQLLREHIAGDLLENPRINEADNRNESILGAIHWRMVFHGFAPTDALDEKVRFTDDQINTFTKAFQGLTVSCARCHDHKFDAISQADYYALFGILGSTRPGRKLIDTEEVLEKNKAELAALKPKIREAVAGHWLNALDDIKAALLDSANYKKEGKSAQSIFHPFYLVEKEGISPADALKRVRQKYTSTQKQIEPALEFDLTKGDDYKDWFQYGNGLSKKPVPSGDFQILPRGDKAIERVLPSGMYSGLLSTRHAGRLTSPDFHLADKHTLQLLVNGDGKAINRYVVQNYPRRGTVYKTERLGDKKKRPDWHWINYKLDYWKGDDIHIELATAKDTAVLVENIDRSWFGIREARLVPTDSPAPFDPALQYLAALATETTPETIEQLADIYIDSIQKSVISWQQDKASDAQALLIDRLLADNVLPNTLSDLSKATNYINQYRKLESQIKTPTRVPGSDEWTGIDQPLFERGNHKTPLEPVSRRFLEAVDASPYASKESGRLELADDLLRNDNPFTRRVIVNRVWTHLFGNGIVGSVDNFGRLGEKPSHPELLDYLAVKFTSEHNWSIKSLIREIVSSETWQKSSSAPEAAKTIDPENRLLSHFPVRRLEAEAIRDKLLAVSGLLDETMFGPAQSGSSSRRSVYLQVIRNRLDPFLAVFDAPVPFSTTGKRPVTNVPAQSLTMLNDPSIRKFATAFANSVEGNEVEKISAMWQKAFGRAPQQDELEASQRFLDVLQSRNTEIESQINSLQTRLSHLSSTQKAIIDPVRKKLYEAAGGQNVDSVDPIDLGAIAAWDFHTTEDLVSGLRGKLTGNAKLINGDLILDGRSSFFSDPLPVDLKEKTLEVTVTLHDLKQRAGGAITVQDLRGVIFDSVVFAERRTNEWLAGSNNHRRTKDFYGKPEAAASEPVHFVLAYDSDGTIRAYKNGKPYGKPYNGGPIIEYRKGATQVVFGLRHGTGNGGNKNLNATIHEGRVYDTALSEDDIASLASGKRIISLKTILQSLTGEQRAEYEKLSNQISTLEQQLDDLDSGETGEKAVWQSFAHSLFNLKEFIYVY